MISTFPSLGLARSHPNPFDSSSGFGFGSEGVYDVVISLDSPEDQDYDALRS